MACPVESLLEDACANGFLQAAQDEIQWRRVMLELLYDASGGGETLAELMEQACANGFTKVAQDEAQWRRIFLQALCNLTG